MPPRLYFVLSFLSASCYVCPAYGEDVSVAPRFQRLQLSSDFHAEGASAADFNGDGIGDVVAGPYWYAGPDYKSPRAYRPAKAYDIEGYSDNFLTFVYDFNGDGWMDILTVGFPGAEAFWYENPSGGDGQWAQRLAYPIVDNESPAFCDVTGDDLPELVCMTGGRVGYAEPDRKHPAAPWHFHPISPDRGYQRFTHGLGVGDLNGDGSLDILEKDGWWEQPDSGATADVWKFHQVAFSEAGSAQMYAYDFDGDGDNDVFTCKAAHGYGLAWFENIGGAERVDFKEHRVTGERPEDNPHGVAFSQPHGIAMADIDGDGVCDIVTGKRYWAHGGHDPGAREPVVLYWFRTERSDEGVEFVPHLIDGDSGVGTQVEAIDVNGNKRPDIVVGNKKGTFLFIQ